MTAPNWSYPETSALLERAEEVIGTLLQWTSNWAVPFEGEDEWLGDKAVAKDLCRQITAELSRGPAQASVIEALAPFAKIAPFVEFTDFRDGEVVHRQSDRDGKRHELTKADFRRAAVAYSSVSSALHSPPEDDCACGGGDTSGHDSMCPESGGK